jgi:hypothetical protein
VTVRPPAQTTVAFHAQLVVRHSCGCPYQETTSTPSGVANIDRIKESIVGPYYQNDGYSLLYIGAAAGYSF